jgi:hypothetical protein
VELRRVGSTGALDPKPDWIDAEGPLELLNRVLAAHAVVARLVTIALALASRRAERARQPAAARSERTLACRASSRPERRIRASDHGSAIGRTARRLHVVTT